MSNFATFGCITFAGFVLLYAAWTDFREWKITNGTVILLTGIYVVYAILATRAGDDWPLTVDVGSAVGAGLLLLAVGFALWFCNLLGAGDAKLMFPVGLFVGWSHLLTFALGLIVGALVVSVLLKIPVPLALSATWPGMRLDEIRKSRKVPYGTVLVAATFFAYATMLAAQ